MTNEQPAGGHGMSVLNIKTRHFSGAGMSSAADDLLERPGILARYIVILQSALIYNGYKSKTELLYPCRIKASDNNALIYVTKICILHSESVDHNTVIFGLKQQICDLYTEWEWVVAEHLATML